MHPSGSVGLREFLREGEQTYADAIGILVRAGLPAVFTQTGGRCGALQVTLERGIVLLTDIDEPLPVHRDEQLGWMAGFYLTDDVSEGPLALAETDVLDAATLPLLVRECVQDFSSSARG